MTDTRYFFACASIVVLMNISGADPHGAIQAYGSSVLPALRGVRAG